MKKKLFTLLAIVMFLIVGTVCSVNATLFVRGVDTVGNQLIYDSDLDVTWYDYLGGVKNWSNSMAWTNSLEVTFDGFVYDGWRLPVAVYTMPRHGHEGPEPDGSYEYSYGYNMYNSEMGHLFYISLENNGFRDTTGYYRDLGDYGINNTGPFNNLRPSIYWTSTDYVVNSAFAIYFNFHTGIQEVYNKGGYYYLIAVRDGDVVAPIPEPCTMLLFGTGLIGMAGVMRRKIKKNNQ